MSTLFHTKSLERLPIFIQNRKQASSFSYKIFKTSRHFEIQYVSSLSKFFLNVPSLSQNPFQFDPIRLIMSSHQCGMVPDATKMKKAMAPFCSNVCFHVRVQCNLNAFSQPFKVQNQDSGIQKTIVFWLNICQSMYRPPMGYDKPAIYPKIFNHISHKTTKYLPQSPLQYTTISYFIASNTRTLP